MRPGPSVLQVREKEPLPETVGEAVFRAIDMHAALLAQGALLTIDAARSRVRLLPIRPDA